MEYQNHAEYLKLEGTHNFAGFIHIDNIFSQVTSTKTPHSCEETRTSVGQKSSKQEANKHCPPHTYLIPIISGVSLLSGHAATLQKYIIMAKWHQADCRKAKY